MREYFIYTYTRNSVELNTPSFEVAVKRRDADTLIYQSSRDTDKTLVNYEE